MPKSSPANAAPRPEIAEIMSLLGQISEKMEPQSGETRRWMQEHASHPAIAEVLEEATFHTLRVVDAICRLEPVNGITISKESNIPKGSVSKITRRLLSRKLITKEYRPNNRKEILFRLTPLGRQLAETHQAFDRQIEQGFVQFLGQYSPDQLKFIAQVLGDFKKISFLE